jgi:Trypsin-co-occurring domain 1
MPIVMTAGTARQILVEVDEVLPELPDDVEIRGARVERVVEVARDLFDDGLDLVSNCAKRVSTGIESLDDKLRPDELELQLSIKLDAQVGAVLTKAGAGTQLQVTMRWSRHS